MFATGQSLLKAVMPHKQLLLPATVAKETAYLTTAFSEGPAANKKKRKTAEQSLLLEKATQDNVTLTEEASEDPKKRKKIKTKKKKGVAKNKAGGDGTLIEDNDNANALTDLGSVVDDAVEIVSKNVVDKLSIKAESNSSMVKATSNNVKTTTKTSIKTEVTVEKTAGSETTAATTSSSEALGGKNANHPPKKIRISQDESHLEPLREREEDADGASPSRASTLSSKSSTSKKKLVKKSLSKKKTGKSAKASSSSLADPLTASMATTPSKSSMAPGAESLLYSNSKTVKQVTTQSRPLTRRAANSSTKLAPGAMTTTTTTTTTTTNIKIDAQASSNAQTPGKVKQMVNMVEARLKTHGPDIIPSTPFTIKKNPTSQLLSTIKAKASHPVSVVAAPATSSLLGGQKIRSSIDNRKIRTSNAKAEAKRQSAKRGERLSEQLGRERGHQAAINAGQGAAQ